MVVAQFSGSLTSQFDLTLSQMQSQNQAVTQTAGESLLTRQAFEVYMENQYLKRERPISVKHQNSIRRESKVPIELVGKDGLYYFKLKDEPRLATIIFEGYLNTPPDNYSFARRNPEASPQVQSARALSSILSSAYADSGEQNPVHQFSIPDNGRSLFSPFANGNEVFHIRNLSQKTNNNTLGSVGVTSGQRFYSQNGVPVSIGFEFVTND